MVFRFSDDEQYAYRLGVGMRGFWLQVEPQPVGSVETKCQKSAFLEGVRFRHPKDNTKEYEREKLNFTFWKVNSKRKLEKDLPDDDLFVQDYILHEAYLAAL